MLRTAPPGTNVPTKEVDVPIYEYRCDECGTTFELRREASASSAPATCAAGHRARRVLSLFATVGQSAPASEQPAAGCGPGCACAANF